MTLFAYIIIGILFGAVTFFYLLKNSYRRDVDFLYSAFFGASAALMWPLTALIIFLYFVGKGVEALVGDVK